MTQEELINTAQVFYHACRVPIALYRGTQCFASFPEARQCASLITGDTDPLKTLDVQMQELYVPQHVKSVWREHFIFLNAGDDLLLLAGPVAVGVMDETRVQRLFRVLRPMLQTQSSMRRYLRNLTVVPGRSTFYLGKMMSRLFLPRESLSPLSEEPLPGELDPSDLSNVVRTATAYIDSHLTDKLTAGLIAEHVQVHPDYLSARFKKETGIAMMVYIQKRRAEEACHFLRYSNISLSEIASLCQFSSQSRFNEVFKRHIGMTPQQYREEE